LPLWLRLRLLGRVAACRALCQPGFAGEFLVETGHDAQNSRLTRTVRPENTDLGIRVEGQVDVIQDLLGPVGLAQARHVINELTCHRAGTLQCFESRAGPAMEPTGA